MDTREPRPFNPTECLLPSHVKAVAYLLSDKESSLNDPIIENESNLGGLLEENESNLGGLLEENESDLAALIMALNDLPTLIAEDELPVRALIIEKEPY